MKEFILPGSELKLLRAAHKEAKRRGDSYSAYRINAVVLLASGWSMKSIAEALMLDDETIRNYVQLYRAGGIKRLLGNSYKGSDCKLSAIEIEKLKEELQTNIYLTTQSVIEFVRVNFRVTYTQSGMRDLLHRLDYEYKKPRLVPGDPDLEAQAFFAEEFEKFMRNKPTDAAVLFMDAVHPQHNTMAAYGWIKRGEKRELKTNSGRERLNLHGAINAETYEITMVESETVNDDSTIDLLWAIEQQYFMASMVYIILDNAKYHFSRKVKEYLQGKNIKLVFLPSYSPNLNLIERLWRFFKKKVLYNKYYKNVNDFRKSCINFFRNLDQHDNEIHNFMSAPFDLA